MTEKKEETALNIYQRVNEIMKKISYVKKDTTIGSGSYSYKAVTHDHVVSLVRPLLIEHGVVIVPNQVTGAVIQKKGQDGAKQMLYSAEYDIKFVNIDQPEDHIVINMTAHANDSGDKAPGKTLTYAVKMAILKLFYLETGINDEAREPVETRPAKAKPTAGTISKDQYNSLVEKIGENLGLRDRLLKAYDLQNLTEIPACNYQAIVKRVQSINFDEKGNK